MKKFDLSYAARMLSIPKIGRNKIYKILRETGTVDERNRPVQKYLDRGYFAVGSRWIRRRYVTLVAGDSGLCFLNFIIREYLLDHPVPSFSKRRKSTPKHNFPEC